METIESRVYGGEMSEALPFPMDNGGTLLDIAQRCWQSHEYVLETSAELLYSVGIIKVKSQTEGKGSGQ